MKKDKNIFKETFGEDYHHFYLEDWIFKEDYALQLHIESSVIRQFPLKLSHKF